ncbi:hypothetical protein BU16DRAFT_541068 [Lophium mytilinum]|uniref:Stress-response A/B barrel domain-containing protein n=1 Tax=Lophium mytilinum TaxID=390894 RepID=A0A6A6QLL1_9PEZI|nr:hypothetical protein BU16DRAFT_541068 [Lophium mytilinum]
MASSSPVVRLTFFKIPDPADIESVVAAFSTIQIDALKVPALNSLNPVHPLNPLNLLNTLQSLPQPPLTWHQDGKKYIFAASTSKLHEDPRSQGYTVAARIIFHSMADMKYYETECAAHAAIKEAGKGKATDVPLVVYMDANPAEAKRMIAMLKDTYGGDGEGKKTQEGA